MPRIPPEPPHMRQLRRHTALLAGSWALEVSLVLTVAVGAAMASIDTDPLAAAGVSGDGVIGGILTDRDGVLHQRFQDVVDNVRTTYTARALTATLLVTVALVAASAAAGWWYGGHAARITASTPARPRPPGWHR